MKKLIDEAISNLGEGATREEIKAAVDEIIAANLPEDQVAEFQERQAEQKNHKAKVSELSEEDKASLQKKSKGQKKQGWGQWFSGVFGGNN